MNTLLAACALTGVCLAASVSAFAGVNSPATPAMGAPPSQTGVDPRMQGNDSARQGIQIGGDGAGADTGIRADFMKNGTGSGDVGTDTGAAGSESKGNGSSGSPLPRLPGAGGAGG
jgi:hypothetical protein